MSDDNVTPFRPKPKATPDWADPKVIEEAMVALAELGWVEYQGDGTDTFFLTPDGLRALAPLLIVAESAAKHLPQYDHVEWNNVLSDIRELLRGQS
jgi:hypothetical protein